LYTMTQAPACYQDVDDVLDLRCVPNTSEDIDVDDVLDLSYVPNTAEDIVLTQAPAPMTVTPGGHTCGNTPFPARVRDLVLEFKKGIKLDPASFAVLKNNKQWDSVHWTLKTQKSCYQDVDDVLDLTYVPSTAEDIVLFEEKRKYMDSVQASRRKKVLSLIEVPMEASQLLKQGSLNSILIKRLIFMASMTMMRSPVPFLSSLLELLLDLNGGVSFLKCTSTHIIRSKES
jgi:hypothetical protein